MIGADPEPACIIELQMTLDEKVVILESATSLFESASRLLMVENTSGFSRKSLEQIRPCPTLSSNILIVR
jgi:hypothetical protein